MRTHTHTWEDYRKLSHWLSKTNPQIICMANMCQCNFVCCLRALRLHQGLCACTKAYAPAPRLMHLGVGAFIALAVKGVDCFFLSGQSRKIKPISTITDASENTAARKLKVPF